MKLALVTWRIVPDRSTTWIIGIVTLKLDGRTNTNYTNNLRSTKRMIGSLDSLASGSSQLREVEEKQRLIALGEYEILDSPPEAVFDDFTKLASDICQVPICLISLVDEQRQWFKSKVGLNVDETPRELAFCAHAICHPEEILIVEDARLDPRFSNNPLVTDEPRIRFYAGSPLVSPSGYAIGTLCAIDRTPRRLTDSQLDCLRTLGRQIVAQLELRRTNQHLLDATRQLQQANQSLTEFAYTASHDLREPLRAVGSFAGLLIRRCSGRLNEKEVGWLEGIENAAQRMETLVKDLLSLANSGRRPTMLPVDCNRLVRHVISDLQYQLTETGGTITHDSLPTIAGNPSQLSQLFQNLLGNALKFNDEHAPIVHVGVKQSETDWTFYVRDNGIGIDPENHEQVFRVFCRLHKSSEYPGTGVGLSICRKVVEQHGGELWLESTPSVGTTFYFRLPKRACTRLEGAGYS